MWNGEWGMRNGKAGFDPRRERSDATRAIHSAFRIPHSALVSVHLAFPCAPDALPHPQADHRRRADRTRHRVRALYLGRPDVDILERRARRLRAEVFQEGVGL